MAIASFSLTGATTFMATTVSSRVVIPTTGTPTILIATNVGMNQVYIALGDATVVASRATSMVLMPGASIALTITPATNIAAITLGGVSSVNVSVGN